MSVRVRYAPSPTGEPHVGNIRAALFNWLFARHEGGSFIVRLEDTDRARYVEGAEQAIFESLAWLGLDFDEGPDPSDPGRDIGDRGPYVQSRRLETYRRHVAQLTEAGHAYRCYCTPERLEQVRKDLQRQKRPPKYDRHCRDLPEAERQRLESQELPTVVRFRTPLSGRTRFRDLIRGDITFENDTLDDFVLLKSDGFPVYHLANVVDDRLMGITHILRGDEWLSSTPRHVLLYQAFDWEPPAFAHLPMILGPDRSKLSKRHGDTSVLAFRDRGFLPEALLNFLGLLGWSLDDHTEIIDRETFVRHFSLDRVLANPAVFNFDKLTWMNGVYIREKLSREELAERIAPLLERATGQVVDAADVEPIVPLIRERIKLLSDAVGMADFLIEEWIGKGFVERPEHATEVLQDVYKELATPGKWDVKSIEDRVRRVVNRSAIDKRVIFGVLREAVTGARVSPPLFETMHVLRKELTLLRIESALRSLSNLTLLIGAEDEIRATTSAPMVARRKHMLGRKNRKAVTGSQTSPASLESVPETETRTTNRTVTPSPFESEDETEGANLTVRSNQEPSSTAP